MMPTPGDGGVRVQLQPPERGWLRDVLPAEAIHNTFRHNVSFDDLGGTINPRRTRTR